MECLRSFPRWLLSLSGLVVLPLLVLTAVANQPPLAWVQRFSDVGKGEDQAQKIYGDAQGNVYLFGTSDDHRSGRGRQLVKYSADGSLVWSNSGPFTTVVADEAGNSFLVGAVQGGAGVLTMKVTAAGVPLWTNRFLGPGDLSGSGLAVCLDEFDNVYVGASVRNAATNSDLVVLAYTSDGSPLWTNRHAVPGKNHASVIDIVADADGHVFVATGGIYPTNSYGDFVVLAFAINGTLLWTNLAPNWYSFTSINLGRWGSQLYVTGTSSNQVLSIAYSNQGVPLWTNFFREALSPNSSSRMTGSAVGDDGTLFVSGSVELWNQSSATVAYSSSGMGLWTNYAGLANTKGVKVGTNGTVYVVAGAWPGWFTLFAYSSLGIPVWTNQYPILANSSDDPIGLVVDASNRVFIAGHSSISYNSVGADFDLVTLACSGDGLPLWTNRFTSSGIENCEVSAVAVGQDGSIFVTGGVGGISKAYDTLTVAFSREGTLLWTNRYAASSTGDDIPYAITVGQNGNVYVAVSSSSGQYLKTIAYATNGLPLWANTSQFNFSATPQAMTVDPFGNVIVTGYTGGGDYVTYAYAGSGVPLWTNRYIGPGVERAHDVAALSDGTIIVTGSSRGQFTVEDYATVAYSSSGVPLWTNRYTSAGANSDVAQSVAVGKSDKIFVTGISQVNFQGNFLTVAYSNLGAPLWTNRLPKATYTPGVMFESVRGAFIALDDLENVYVAGSIVGNGGSDYAVLALSSGGVPLWTNYFGLPGSEDLVSGLVYDRNGHVIVTGQCRPQAQGLDFDLVTVAYSTNGLAMWTNRYNGPGNGPDLNQFNGGIGVGASGEVVIAGTSDGKAYQGLVTDIICNYAILKFGNLNTPLMQKPEALIGNQWLVGFEGSPGLEYTIERALDVTGPWQTVGSTNAGANGKGVVLDLAPPLERGFYRGRHQ